MITGVLQPSGLSNVLGACDPTPILDRNWTLLNESLGLALPMTVDLESSAAPAAVQANFDGLAAALNLTFYPVADAPDPEVCVQANLEMINALIGTRAIAWGADGFEGYAVGAAPASLGGGQHSGTAGSFGPGRCFSGVPAAPVNLCLPTNTPAPAYSGVGSTNDPWSGVCDGRDDTAVFAINGGHNGVTAIVDLGMVRNVSAYRVAQLVGGPYNASAYNVDSSPDGAAWTTRASVSGAPSDTGSVALGPLVSARYWRVVCTSGEGGHWAITEFSLFGLL